MQHISPTHMDEELQMAQQKTKIQENLTKAMTLSLFQVMVEILQFHFPLVSFFIDPMKWIIPIVN